ncbi:MAG: histidine triad nucleotide-binding protein [Legionellales bacterium]|nr:histidine triad nucleotide-binding protein [Legionellales bacterium]|tara:strand:- start:282 stop:623 length:342 start_codon:yes stop_codon:yes gene_type:complete
MNCLFCKIIDKKIPASITFENDNYLAFNDIDPKAPVHQLIIPKQHIATLNDISKSDMPIIADIFTIAQALAQEQNIAESGYRLINNCNVDGGQTVFHIHFHLLGGKQLIHNLG